MAKLRVLLILDREGTALIPLHIRTMAGPNPPNLNP